MFVFSVGDWSKSENNAFFYNVDLIDEAIEHDRRIAFDYNKYGADKKLRKSKSHETSPYQMILRNQHYFLMACDEAWGDVTFYRVDKISNIRILDAPRTPLREVRGYEHGILVRNGCRRRSDRRQDNQGDLDGKPPSNGILGVAILQLCGSCITAASARQHKRKTRLRSGKIQIKER